MSNLTATTQRERGNAQMKIFTILGFILDSFLVAGSYGDLTIEDKAVINELVAPICGEEATDHNWHTCTFNFIKNPQNKTELKSVTLSNSGCQSTYYIGDKILSVLTPLALDELYFKLCEEICF